MKNQFVGANRVEMELTLWRSREERFTKLFSMSISANRPLLREKLHHYERAAIKYKGTSDPEERFALQVMRQERRQMEKQLYPNFLLRMLRRLLVLPAREKISVRKDVKNTEANSRSLKEQIQKAGFSGLASKLDEQIRQGQPQFSIPNSYYINERERVDHQLHFVRDHTGNYQFNGFQAKLYDETKPEASRQYYVEAREGMDIGRVYQLLEGRAVQKAGNWIQLDLNDKDAQGNNRVKEFPSSYGFDLERVLQDLPIKELRNQSTAYQLLDKLKQGSREAVSFLQDNREYRYYIEANPQFKSVSIFDEHSRKVTLSSALGNKTPEAIKISQQMNQQQQLNFKKLNGVKVHH